MSNAEKYFAAVLRRLPSSVKGCLHEAGEVPEGGLELLLGSSLPASAGPHPAKDGTPANDEIPATATDETPASAAERLAGAGGAEEENDLSEDDLADEPRQGILMGPLSYSLPAFLSQGGPPRGLSPPPIRPSPSRVMGGPTISPVSSVGGEGGGSVGLSGACLGLGGSAIASAATAAVARLRNDALLSLGEPGNIQRTPSSNTEGSEVSGFGVFASEEDAQHWKAATTGLARIALLRLAFTRCCFTSKLFCGSQ